ncbi:MAG: hypothetical protein ACI9HK_005662 [Pirellulaceae bacterium]|jgi:hypothetical protein
MLEDLAQFSGGTIEYNDDCTLLRASPMLHRQSNITDYLELVR